MHGSRLSGWRHGPGANCFAFTLAARRLHNWSGDVRPGGGWILSSFDLGSEGPPIVSLAHIGFLDGSRGRRPRPPSRIDSRSLEDRTGKQSQGEPRTLTPVQSAFADIGLASHAEFRSLGDFGSLAHGSTSRASSVLGRIGTPTWRA